MSDLPTIMDEIRRYLGDGELASEVSLGVLDSLELIDLVVHLEAFFHVSIPASSMSGATCFRHLAKAVMDA